MQRLCCITNSSREDDVLWLATRKDENVTHLPTQCESAIISFSLSRSFLAFDITPPCVFEVRPFEKAGNKRACVRRRTDRAMTVPLLVNILIINILRGPTPTCLGSHPMQANSLSFPTPGFRGLSWPVLRVVHFVLRPASGGIVPRKHCAR